jgi:hypothetical protein
MPRTEQQKKQAQAGSHKKGVQGELRAFRLLAGQHIQADHEWEPPEEAVKRTRSGYFLDDEGEIIKDPETERPIRCPSRTYSAGDVVLSTRDLCDTHGHQKFQPLDDDATQRLLSRKSFTPGDVTGLNEREAPARAPHGQVTTGHADSSGQPGPGDAIPNPVTHPPTSQMPMAPGADVEQKGQPTTGPSTSSATTSASGKQRKSTSDLDRMSTAELREVCKEEEVEVPRNATREQMLKILKSS